ncbi:MAG: ChaN family lipoprotein [Thermodesulfovibrionales bacterium]|nr:ChaN family lipoprotein [Thermodesulfovibrionales bacterium]
MKWRKVKHIPLFSVFMVSVIFGYSCGMKVPDIPYKIEPGQIIETKTGKRLSFPELVQHLNSARVIYVGETHDNPDHHAIQLRVIKALYEKESNISIGLEMLERTNQEVLDRWTKGQLKEEDFFKESQWAKCWGYDYHLYKPIFNFARGYSLKLIALNAPSEIVQKIGKRGIESLTEEELRLIPLLDTSNEAHRRYVGKYFDEHKDWVRDFDSFYHAQCAWEDTMADTIARYLSSPGASKKMVVLIGNAHIAYHFGVPERAYIRNKLPYKTLLLVEKGSEIEKKEIADFVWITERVKREERQKIGLKLRKMESRPGLVIEAVEKGGLAEKSGACPSFSCLVSQRVNVYEVIVFGSRAREVY